MVRRLYKLVGLLLVALLLAASVAPTTGRAEAQMRCPGASPRSAPCARADVPAAGMSDRQVYTALMACCRSMRGECPMMRDCPAQHPALSAAHRANLSARRCLVSLRLSTVPVALAAPRVRWLLTAAPALAPPTTAPTADGSGDPLRAAFWTYSPTFSPHLRPDLHGLRAPPTA